mmetsp:Transcript_84439/g.196303  ORF Transcript_84439/g.196303 Transcript_84439/m.196303 type:complete len:323 (-) Transcript_84439:78-1046(-)
MVSAVHAPLLEEGKPTDANGAPSRPAGVLRARAGIALAAGLALRWQASTARGSPAHGLATLGAQQRGGESVEQLPQEELPAAVLKQLDQATSYFSNSVRVPAALIAGQAGNMLHRLTEMGTVQRAQTSPAAERTWSLRTHIYVALWRAHLLLIGYTVCAQLTAVLLCSTAHAQILDIGWDRLQLEPTAFHLIIRHVEFEYVTVRIAFFSGLVSFLLAVATRAVASLGAGPKQSTVTGNRELLLCAALGAMLVTTLTWWTHIYNEEMPNEEPFYLLRRFTVLFWDRLRSSTLTRLTAVSAAASLCLGTASLLSASTPRPANTG